MEVTTSEIGSVERANMQEVSSRMESCSFEASCSSVDDLCFFLILLIFMAFQGRGAAGGGRTVSAALCSAALEVELKKVWCK